MYSFLLKIFPVGINCCCYKIRLFSIQYPAISLHLHFGDLDVSNERHSVRENIYIPCTYIIRMKEETSQLTAEVVYVCREK